MGIEESYPIVIIKLTVSFTNVFTKKITYFLDSVEKGARGVLMAQ